MMPFRSLVGRSMSAFPFDVSGESANNRGGVSLVGLTLRETVVPTLLDLGCVDWTAGSPSREVREAGVKGGFWGKRSAHNQLRRCGQIEQTPSSLAINVPSYGFPTNTIPITTSHQHPLNITKQPVPHRRVVVRPKPHPEARHPLSKRLS